ncbi:MAG: TetR/AcrR family transcriptional regulator [Betaproteobacteria bacterium]|nr:TetR/AcrR family transcriptional regulator [Betaproteobacteria bacterium]
MSKGEQTRKRILERAAQLLNQRGFLSSSVSEIMEATGMQKGGIYNHFKSKEDLAVQAFDYAVERIAEKYRAALEGKEHAVDRLVAVITLFEVYEGDAPFAGGCPLMNCAIESDDTSPVLRARARQAMDQWRDMFVRIIAKGISRGEIRPHVHPDTEATLFITSLEGAVMMSNLYKDPVHLRRVIARLVDYVNGELKT